YQCHDRRVNAFQRHGENELRRELRLRGGWRGTVRHRGVAGVPRSPVYALDEYADIRIFRGWTFLQFDAEPGRRAGGDRLEAELISQEFANFGEFDNRGAD